MLTIAAFICLSVTDSSSTALLLDRLSDAKSWMALNSLSFNERKMERTPEVTLLL